MKTVSCLILALLLSCFPSPTNATCRPFDSFVIRLNDEVLVAPDPRMIRQGYQRYEAGTVCFIHFMASIEEIGHSPGWVLVRYTPSYTVSLRECPNGTEYLMPQQEWADACRDDRQLRLLQGLRRLIQEK